VDDHPLVREWLTNLINREQDLTVCGESASLQPALQAITNATADAVVVDVALQDSSGIELIKELKKSCPHIAVLVLSMHDEELYAERALRAGAKGYIVKREATKKVIRGLRQVLEGKFYFSERVMGSIASQFAAGKTLAEAPSAKEFSDRELEVFELLGQGLGTRQIAERLKVSIKTVQAYCGRMKEKLNVEGATELLREAIRWNESRNPP
jgi:DNA-binding NarL/FixJ family response regulator